MRSFVLVILFAACDFGAAPVQPDTAAGDAAAPDSATAFTCAGKAMPPHSGVWTVDAGDLLRVVTVHVPPSYDPTRGTPLVLDFHGFTSDGVQEQILSRMTDKADEAGFIAMHPTGLGVPRSWNAGACCGLAAATEADDVAFVRALLDKASEELCIDPARVYATGMSNGAFFSHRLGCELSDRIAAIAPVAGTIGIPVCSPTRAVPVIAFNGDADPLVPYTGSSTLGFPSVPEAFAAWAARNGCSGAPVETYAKGDARCLTYTQCTDDAHVTQCTIDGGGHTWPGGIPIPVFGKTSSDLSATDAMWEFFAAHPLD